MQNNEDRKKFENHIKSCGSIMLPHLGEPRLISDVKIFPEPMESITTRLKHNKHNLSWSLMNANSSRLRWSQTDKSNSYLLPLIKKNAGKGCATNGKLIKNSISAQLKKRADLLSLNRTQKPKSILRDTLKAVEDKIVVPTRDAEVPSNRTENVVRIENNKREISEEEKDLIKAKAERTLDNLIRSMKPSFRRSIVNCDPTANIQLKSNKMGKNEFNMKSSEVENLAVDEKKTDENKDNQEKNLPDDRTEINESNAELHPSRLSTGEMNIYKRVYECGGPYPQEPTPQDRNYERMEALCKTRGNSKFVTLLAGKKPVRIPIKKITSIKHYPEDPLLKMRQEKRLYSKGFKPNLRSGSVHTEEDNVMTQPVALTRLCEAYTKNMGRDWLLAMAKGSAIDTMDSDDEEIPPHWLFKQTIVDDPIQRLWKCENLPVESKFPSRNPIKQNDEDDMSSLGLEMSFDEFRGSLGPNDYDAKSDLAALMIDETDGSTDIEFDENDFVIGNDHHPFTDPVIEAGYQHRCRARDKYHRKRTDRNNTCISTSSMVSDIDSFMHENEDSVKRAIPNVEQSVQEEEHYGDRKQIEFIENDPEKKTIDDDNDDCLGPSKEGKISIKDVDNDSTLGPPDLSKTVTMGTVKSRKKSSLVYVKKKISVKSKTSGVKTIIQSEEESQINMLRNESSFDQEKFTSLEAGFDNVAINWSKIIAASEAPNPMRWFEALEAMSHQEIVSELSSDGSGPTQHEMEAYGLGKRFISVAGGLEELRNLLRATAENDQPKAELLLDCMVKNYVLQMPLAVGNSARIKELYMQTIVQNPILYKMVLRRRSILPDDLQAFVKRIIEITESSDGIIATLLPSKSQVNLITSAAKEMFDSGFLAGGPKCPFLTATQTQRKKKNKDIESGKEEENNEVEEVDVTQTNRVYSYGSDLNYEKAFYTSMRNPSGSILEEVAFYIPQFAYHVRPLFETKWEAIATDSSPESLVPELASLRDLRQTRMYRVKSQFWYTQKEEEDEVKQTRVLCKALVHRLCNLVRGPAGNRPGSDVWMAFLATLNGITLWPPIGDFLICKLNFWIPPLLLTLHSEFPSLREEGCCVISFLVSNYHLFSRLHYHSRYLLVANITLSLFTAIENAHDSYAFFHGTLAYLLHAIPCNSVIDCLLLWVPDLLSKDVSCRTAVPTATTSLMNRDWPRFLYYAVKQWPAYALKWNLLYQRQILLILEMGIRRPESKYNARLALSYMMRRTAQMSTIITCWRERNDER